VEHGEGDEDGGDRRVEKYGGEEAGGEAVWRVVGVGHHAVIRE
jgi:hypothetical protein